MKRPAFLIDAFTNTKFAGNQAAKLADQEYQRIAAEFNLSETTYPVSLEEGKDFKTGSLFSLRWFTPTDEVPLCGHATLATSHVLFYEIGNANASLTFRTLSGDLIVKKADPQRVVMDFPQYSIAYIPLSNLDSPFKQLFPEFTEANLAMFQAIVKELIPENLKVIGVTIGIKAKKLLIVLDSETTSAEFATIHKNHPLIEIHPEGCTVRGVIVTMAPKNPEKQGFVDVNGRPFDYVCRYFAPWVGIAEDPATGSAQCALGPFWARVFERKQLYGLQAYPGRGAQFDVTLEENDRISITGKAVTVLRGEIDTE
ncbi:unnamed protein product, partial [Mesorhabditis belari]|uniref:Uncharacterized protein n=1 Tax=Mesorhabditis belari TaxID=2138241 RepID=A0AAF3FM76_9BILA